VKKLNQKKKNLKMAILKSSDIEKMNKKERNEKLKELKQELIKTKISSNKSGKGNTKEIKRTIARILTLNRINKSIEKK